MKTLTILIALSLSGCATIQEHPYATSFVVALAAGSIAASQHHDYRQSVAAAPPAVAQAGAPSCATGACQ